jgi:iron complex outermembrane receptor protein
VRFIVTAATLILAAPAFAQRADDNPLTAAQDAFGTTVGDESIGLYFPEDVRGFNAIEAGNARLDGLYFDRQTNLTDHLIDSTAIRVGISGQGYPLPAPTGIADYKLRRPGSEYLTSAVLGYGAFDGYFISGDTQLPLLGKTFSLGLGATLGHNEFEYGYGQSAWSAAAVGRWRPADVIEIVPFWTRERLDNDGANPAIFVGGSWLPPEYRRGRYFGQDWTGEDAVSDTFGTLVEAALSDSWALKAGVFRSIYHTRESYFDMFLDAQPDGSARHVIIADPDQRFASTSGELRVARLFESGASRHSIQLAARARDQQRRYGGSDSVDVGTGHIGEPSQVEKPLFTFGPQTRDRVRQRTLGVAYQAEWPDHAVLTLGLQKAFYRKNVAQPLVEGSITGTDEPWLFNAGGTLHVNERLAFYASFSRGLEDGGVAPDNAVNKNAAAPALRTEQYDAGLRYALTPKLKLVAGVFDISKPYNNLDENNFYRQLGEQRHRGVELSLAGDVTDQVSVVMGTVIMSPEVTGEEVDRGAIGSRPVGQTGRTSIITAAYRFAAVPGLSVDTDIVSYGRRMASLDNRVEIPSRVVVGVGGRYQFTFNRAQATLRVKVGNVFDRFGWRTGGSGVFEPNAQRWYSVNLAADF